MPYLNSDDQFVSLRNALQHLDDFREPLLERRPGRRRAQGDAHCLHISFVRDGERFGAVQENTAVACARDEGVGTPWLRQAHP